MPRRPTPPPAAGSRLDLGGHAADLDGQALVLDATPTADGGTNLTLSATQLVPVAKLGSARDVFLPVPVMGTAEVDRKGAVTAVVLEGPETTEALAYATHLAAAGQVKGLQDADPTRATHALVSDPLGRLVLRRTRSG